MRDEAKGWISNMRMRQATHCNKIWQHFCLYYSNNLGHDNSTSKNYEQIQLYMDGFIYEA